MDHRQRYEMAADFLKNSFAPPQWTLGLDCFCGAGYGTHIMADALTNANIIGIDASEESVRFADHYYGHERIFFTTKRWPFVLGEKKFDFVVSFESIEHVEDGLDLLDKQIAALKDGGYLLFSVPNERLHPLEKNPNAFHFRHYTHDEVLAALKGKVEIMHWYGQDMFAIENGVKTGMLAENEMGLKENVEGQVLVYCCKK